MPQTGPAPKVELAPYQAFALRSSILSADAGGDVDIRAMVFVPPGHTDERLAVNYVIHGFGGDHERSAARIGPMVERALAAGTAPPMIYVFLDASHRTGHHVFADSANNGRWASALVTEFIPALEAKFGAVATTNGRFVSGHSSGGWASLWLMVSHPQVFGGVWSTAPDPVDFRAFTGVDIYAFENMYESAAGEDVMLMRDGERWTVSLREYLAHEVADAPTSGQFYSFDAVFSPRGDNGPLPLFDRKTGIIDRDVAEAWKRFDISYQLRTRWADVGAALEGKLHITVGTLDTFGLDAGVRLLDQELDRLGSDAEFVYVPGRNHFDLYDPQPELYPDGLIARMAQEMNASYEAGRTSMSTTSGRHQKRSRGAMPRSIPTPRETISVRPDSRSVRPWAQSRGTWLSVSSGPNQGS